MRERRRSFRSRARSVYVPRAAMGVARFAFAELCERPLAAVDYLRSRASSTRSSSITSR